MSCPGGSGSCWNDQVCIVSVCFPDPVWAAKVAEGIVSSVDVSSARCLQPPVREADEPRWAQVPVWKELF